MGALIESLRRSWETQSAFCSATDLKDTGRASPPCRSFIVRKRNHLLPFLTDKETEARRAQ